MRTEDYQKDRVLMVYGKTPFTPGRYLEDGLRSIEVAVDVIQDQINFSQLDQQRYTGIIFIESPSKPAVKVKNIHMVKIPKLFWIHHGENRLLMNIKLAKAYQPDLILMAHSLHLTPQFPKPVKFFPFAMAESIFNCPNPLIERELDIAFAGGKNSKYYQNRNRTLLWMNHHLKDKYALSLYTNVYLKKLASLYGNAKVVFNQSADQLKTINMRIFEGVSCGALVMTDQVPFQQKIFQDGSHFVIYKDRKDLSDKIDYYLHHLEKAQELATNGYQYLLSNHTYQHRARDIMRMFNILR